MPSLARNLATAALLAFGLGSAVPDARAQAPEPAPSWPEVKCARYKKAYADAIARVGTRGLGQVFLERHDAFMAAGCTSRADVCARSPEELDLANRLVIMAMNQGVASTFLPFTCRN